MNAPVLCFSSTYHLTSRVEPRCYSVKANARFKPLTNAHIQTRPVKSRRRREDAAAVSDWGYRLIFRSTGRPQNVVRCMGRSLEGTLIPLTHRRPSSTVLFCPFDRRIQSLILPGPFLSPGAFATSHLKVPFGTANLSRLGSVDSHSM